ncbi:PilL N-terminal domain-containing protein [Klebsiella pneumoniae]|uniref:PilL N-terminal domain-containing protein n=1 Tax=Klebsiella pneumoniae TaxID=573 RepID=A0A927HIG9_KLEPN|nr:PilL N-terminal domain-containing protein [Klebsiella pneumoniae]
MRMKTLPICLALTSLLLGGCADKPAQPTEAVADIAIPLNVGYAQPLLPDIYPSAPEVVRYDRYRLVDISPSQAQRYPLEQIVHLRIPASVSPTVGDALHYALRDSGYRLCTSDGQANHLYRLPLPAVHYQMGSIRLNVALQILVGPARQLWVDDVQREVCYRLRPEYTPSAPDAGMSGMSGASSVSVVTPLSAGSTPLPVPPVLNTSTGHTDVNKVHRGGWLK